jgi:hypothetical protein
MKYSVEGAQGGWCLKGVSVIARLAKIPGHKDPILIVTTNFIPLIELCPSSPASSSNILHLHNTVRNHLIRMRLLDRLDTPLHGLPAYAQHLNLCLDDLLV